MIVRLAVEGFAQLDTGTHQPLQQACHHIEMVSRFGFWRSQSPNLETISEYVQTIQERQGISLACLCSLSEVRLESITLHA